MSSFPRRALLDGHSRPVRVLAYEGNGFFTVLRSNGVSEDEVFVRRERLTFLKDAG